MYEDIQQWIDETGIVDQLKKYVRYRSRSNYEEEVAVCADYSKSLLEKAGFKVEIIQTSGNPLVLGTKRSDTSSNHLLFYGHYDVQHEGNLDLWNTEPFEPVIKDGKMYGRGTADNKGQHFAHIKAVEYVKNHAPEIFDKLNVSIILDGDEERGSFSLAEVFQERKDDLDADILVVSDGPALVYDRPTIVGSVRGILTFQITIQHNDHDVHSGNYGGLARSATADMIYLLNAMVDADGYCKIAGFYQNVDTPSEKELELMTLLEPVFDEIQKMNGYTEARVQEGKSVYFQNQFWPTMNINGIKSGGVKKNRRTIIPAEITASVDCRLVPSMRSDQVQAKITEFITAWGNENNCEDSISVEFEHAMEPITSSLDNPKLDILKEALTFGFGTNPLIVPRLGGSLPLYLFKQYLNKDVFLIPLALPDENNHAPNENLDLDYFRSGIVSSVKLLHLVAKN